MQPDKLLSAETVELEKLAIGLKQSISQEFISGVSVRAWQDIARDSIDIQIRAYVLSHDLDHYEWVEYPTWVEHFKHWLYVKHSWISMWLSKKWPVKCKVKTLDIKAIFPELTKKIRLPDERWTVKVYKSEDRRPFTLDE